MSSDADNNLEIVRRALLAQNQADDEAFTAAMAPDIEWDAGRNPFGLPEHLHGPEEIRRAAHAARERAGRLAVTLHELRADGDAVLVLGTLSAGTDMTMPRGWIWILRDGSVIRVRAFGSHSAAVTAYELHRHEANG